jgi:Fe2+ transport system protein FeoA
MKMLNNSKTVYSTVTLVSSTVLKRVILSFVTIVLGLFAVIAYMNDTAKRNEIQLTSQVQLRDSTIVLREGELALKEGQKKRIEAERNEAQSKLASAEHAKQVLKQELDSSSLSLRRAEAATMSVKHEKHLVEIKLSKAIIPESTMRAYFKRVNPFKRHVETN